MARCVLASKEIWPAKFIGGRLTTQPQTKTVETTQAELQVDNNANLPPLMNPAMLEASEDLTNLSHLNEPAGSSRRQMNTLLPPLTALKFCRL